MARKLGSSDNWQYFNLGPGRKGKKILGRGSYGIAGLWDYGGPAEAAPAIEQVVVKQIPLSAYDKDGDPYIEGNILQLLAGAKSRHIIEQYGPPREEPFNGEKVIRLFLEYCPGGTLEKFMEDDGRKERVSRRSCWSGCLDGFLLSCAGCGGHGSRDGGSDIAVEQGV
jgi:hypothetical protein